MLRRTAAYAAGLMACSALTTPAFAQDQDDAEARSLRDDNTIIVTATAARRTCRTSPSR